MSRKTAFVFLVVISVILFTLGCAKKGTKSTPPGESTAKGWAKFESGDYNEAINNFNSAIAGDPNYSEAYLGLGWSYAVLSNDSLSVKNLEKYLSFPNPDSITSDAKAGLAFAYQAQKECSLAIDKAKEVLSFNPSWKFTHDTTYSASDLHLLLAECYYALSDFESSLAEVQILNPGFSAYVNTAVGRGALADEIERLRRIV
jgi:tetratricopeptide (TPR) repeat protein